MRNVLDSTNHRIVREFSWEYAEAGHLMIRWQLVTPYRSILVLNLLSPLVENSSCPVICGSGADIPAKPSASLEDAAKYVDSCNILTSILSRHHARLPLASCLGQR